MHATRRGLKVKPDSKLILFYVALGAINFYALYKMLNSNEDLIIDKIPKVLLYFYGAVLIISSIVAASHNFKYDIKKSMHFMFFVFGISFSDLSSFLSSMYNFEILFYIDRIVYLFSLFFVVDYILIGKDTRKSYWLDIT